MRLTHFSFPSVRVPALYQRIPPGIGQSRSSQLSRYSMASIAALVGLALVIGANAGSWVRASALSEQITPSVTEGIGQERSVADEASPEQAWRDYEALRQKISARVQAVTEEYGDPFMRRLREKLQEASESDTLDEPICVSLCVENAEHVRENSALWDRDIFGPEWWSRNKPEWSQCRIAPGLVITVATPYQRIDLVTGRGRLGPDEVEISIDRGYYGPRVPNAGILNRVFYDYALGYLCKLLQGRLEANELRNALEETFAGGQITRDYGDRSYSFHRDINNIVVTFKW